MLKAKNATVASVRRQMNIELSYVLYSFVVRIFLMSLDMKGEGTKLLFLLITKHMPLLRNLGKLAWILKVWNFFLKDHKSWNLYVCENRDHKIDSGRPLVSSKVA